MTDTLNGADYEIVDDSQLPDVEQQQGDINTVEEFDVRKLPDVRLDDTLRKEIELWLGQQITNMRAERQEMEAEWEEIEYLYELTELPEEEQTDFPFENSAHLVMQIIAMYTETTWAKLLNTIHAPSEPFNTEPLRKEFIPLYKPLKRFITWAAKNELDLRAVNSILFMNLVKLGTCISKTVYVREERPTWVYDAMTRKYNKVMVRTKDYPQTFPVELADLLFPIGTRKFEDADIKAHRFDLSYAEVKRRLVSGEYNLPEEEGIEAMADLKAWVSNKRSPSDQSMDMNLGVSPRRMDTLEFYEVWFEYAINGPEGDDRGDSDDHKESTSRGLPIKLEAVYNTNTGKLFRIRHNWYPLQLDPFDMCVYMPRTKHAYGIGIGKMALPTQKEITAMHNQRLDNATIANANIVLIKDDSLLPLNFRVGPGGTYRVSDPNEINIKPLGQKYDSTIGEEQHTLSMLERRIGIQDYSPDQKVQTSTQAIVNMQELTRKFDAVVGNVRPFEARIMLKNLLLYQQFYPDGKPVLLLGEDGTYVEQMFKLPPNMIASGIAVSVTATTSATSKELDRQAKLSLFNMLTQYYGQLTQYVLQASNPQMPPPVQQTLLRIVEALGELVRDILEDFDVAERDRLVIQLGQQLSASPGAPGSVEPGMATQPQPAAATGGNGAGQVPRLADIQRLLANQGGTGTPGAA